MYSLPTRILPAIILICLWVLVLGGNCFGGAIDRFAAEIAPFAFLATFLIVPYTILVALYSLFSTKQNNWKTIRPIGFAIRILAALALTLLTLALWPRPNISYKFFSVSNKLADWQPETWLAGCDPKVIASIPRGERELRALPDKLFEEHWLSPQWQEPIDAWDNPYMLRAEDRPHGLWVEIYSTGRDGISTSHGNDPDDLNTWGQDGDFYMDELYVQSLKRLALEGGITFLFYVSMGILVARHLTASRISESPS